LAALADVLAELYPAEHELLFYRASIYPIAPAATTRIRLDELAKLPSAPAGTLYVPPLPARPVDAAMAERLGLTPS
jgi:hypothetical protein